MQNCGFPKCRGVATGTFALVPLCEEHLDIIQTETRKWYNGLRNMSYRKGRPEYLLIADQIPWSKPMMDLKYGRETE